MRVGVPAGSEQDLLAISEVLGTPIVAFWLRKPVLNSNGNPIGIAGIIGDIADVLSMARESSTTRHRAQWASTSLSRRRQDR